MKLLFDQNLSYRLASQLHAIFPDSAHVRDLGLAKSSDSEVWEHAKAHGFVLVSKDSDFQQRAILHGFPPKVIWVRLGNCSTSEVEALLNLRQQEIATFDADPSTSFLVLS